MILYYKIHVLVGNITQASYVGKSEEYNIMLNSLSKKEFDVLSFLGEMEKPIIQRNELEKRQVARN